MTVIAYLTEAVVVEKILAHLGMPATPPAISPARLTAQIEMFDDSSPDQASSRPRRCGARGPPEWLGGGAAIDNDDADATDAAGWGS